MYFYHAASGKWLPIRQTLQYRYRCKRLRDYWLLFATSMLFVAPPMVLVLSLLATFLSFMFLDEVEYDNLTPL